jgi:hypothetical protein
VPSGGRPDVEPTSTHELVDAHDTPETSTKPVLGLGATVQVWPFQFSAKAVELLLNPTAMQALAAVHDTPVKPEAGAT